jgi:dTDP-glucose pyrophosphorylase
LRIQQGVVLAAGRATRLKSLGISYPKPLLPICNKPIMQYQLEAMRRSGILNVAIVLSPNGDPIRNYFRDGTHLGLHISYLIDEEPAGIASSLLVAEPWVTGAFALFLGDVFVALTDFDDALRPVEAGAGATIVTRDDTREAIQRNFAVLTGADGRVFRVVEKPAEPPSTRKGVGIYVFTQAIFDAIRRTPRSALRNEYEITDAIQTLIDMGPPVYPADIARWDINVNSPQDLLDANMRVLREEGLDSLVGTGASVGTASLRSTVVGDRAVIDGTAVLDECLVLPQTLIAADGRRFSRHIFTDQVVYAVEVMA